jgi:hypothetical protein
MAASAAAKSARPSGNDDAGRDPTNVVLAGLPTEPAVRTALRDISAVSRRRSHAPRRAAGVETVRPGATRGATAGVLTTAFVARMVDTVRVRVTGATVCRRLSGRAVGGPTGATVDRPSRP